MTNSKELRDLGELRRVVADTLALEMQMIYIIEELERIGKKEAASHVAKGLDVLHSGLFRA